ncbi:MAG: glycosyltransferase family 39 protein [Candidatus Acidiferrales bacterium]
MILVIALLLRLGFAWSYTNHHSKQALGVIPFLFESGNISYSLAIGTGFSSPFHSATGPTAWMTPIYPLLIAAVFRFFGVYTFHAFEAAVLLNILFSTLCCIPIYFAGKRIGGAALGAGAAWLWAIFPNAILIPVESMWDASLAALLAATILWATLALADSRRMCDWCAYGLLWGVALMATATLASLLPLLLGWLAYRARRDSRPWLKMPATALAVAILCCVPWTIRNYAVFHSFVPLRSTLGLQLWVGNNPQAKPIWLGNFHPIHDEDEREKYVAMGEIAYMREKRNNAIRFMFTHPRKEAYLISERFIEVWSGGTPNPWNDFLRERSLRFRAVLIANVLVAFGALFGIIELVRRRSVHAFPLAVFPVVFPWAYYLTVVLPRYRLPIDPAVLLLTAIAFGAFWERSTGNHKTRGASKHLLVPAQSLERT